jgi:hypothetical protein
MKPTSQQEENLRTYLRNELLYRETYEEVYDHILTALEQKPQDISFQDSVNQIIKDDFGGGQDLVEMEKKCYKLASDEAISQQWNYFKSNFKFPKLIYTLILFLTIYLIVSKIAHASFIISFLVFTGFVVPGILILLRYFNVGYYTLDTKKSIKDNIMRKIAYLFYQVILFPLMLLLNHKKYIDSFIIDHTIIIDLGITVLILYILSFIKLSRDEFKVYITR